MCFGKNPYFFALFFALAAGFLAVTTSAASAQAERQPHWPAVGPVYQIVIEPGKDLLDRAFRKCPAGFRERNRSLNPGTLSQTVQFQCLAGVQVPGLPSLVEIGRRGNDPLYRVACAKMADCIKLVVRACPAGKTETQSYGAPTPRDGHYYRPGVQVGNAWKKATFYSFYCD